MIEKARVEFESLFLPDTQAARLEAEQAAFRAALIAADLSDRGDLRDRGDLPDRTALPFNAFPPICPIEAMPSIPGSLSIGPAISIDGWIVRPVSSEVPSNIQAVTVSLAPYPPPPLPKSGAFILLGYAGERAGSLVTEVMTSEVETTSKVGAAFTVHVWYRATFTLEIARGPGASIVSSWKVGTERWVKPARGKKPQNSKVPD